MKKKRKHRLPNHGENTSHDSTDIKTSVPFLDSNVSTGKHALGDEDKNIRGELGLLLRKQVGQERLDGLVGQDVP